MSVTTIFSNPLVWVGLIFLFLFVIAYVMLAMYRRGKWYILEILGDYNNPHAKPATFLLSEKYEKGVTTGKVWGSYFSILPKFTINSIPDLQSVSYKKHLFCYRGVTGLTGDINYVFVRPPLIAKPSAEKLISKMTTDIDAAIRERVAKLTPEQKQTLLSEPGSFDELVLKAIDTEWVTKNIGLVTIKKEDVLLREDRVVHAAINSDSADFSKAHMDKWQKLMQVLYPMSIIAIIIAFSIGAYIQYNGQSQYQQQTYQQSHALYQQWAQIINQTNAENQWLFADLKAVNVYGIQPPKNLTPINPVVNSSSGSILPSVP